MTIHTRTVFNTLLRVGSNEPIVNRRVSLQLNQPAFTGTGNEIEVLKRDFTYTDSTGKWSFVLQVQSDFDPVGTWYTVHEPSGVWSFVVPDGSTDITLHDCLINPPAGHPPPVPISGGSSVAYVDSQVTAERVRAEAAEALALLKAANLSDLANVGTARANLGLGGAAVLNVGTTAGTVAAGDDGRFGGGGGGDMLAANNLSDLTNVGTARTNLGLGSAALASTAAFDAAGAATAAQAAAIAASAQRAANLSDLANVGTARTNLGLGSAATHPATDFLSATAATATNVLGLGIKGDVVTVTDAAITSGAFALSSVTAAFTNADVGKRVQVVNAEVPYNVRGAWAATTVYATEDLVTFSGGTYICRSAHTSAATFQINNWAYLPYAGQTARTLCATILSVSGGVATLDVAAGNTVSGATLTYGTDDSAAAAALGAGHYYFPGSRTYFIGEWFMASSTTVQVGAAAVFKLPYYQTTDAAVFRLLTFNRSSATMLRDIHLYGKYVIDMTELTPPIGTNLRGVHVLNCQDWSVDQLVGVGIPGSTGNAMQVGSNQAGAQFASKRGRVNSITNTVVRGLGSSCVQQSAGFDTWYGTLWTDGGCAGRFEMDGHTGDICDNIVVDLAHHTGATASLGVNSAVTLKPHLNAMSNVHVKAIIAEGTADGVGAGYDVGGSLKNVLIERMRVSGGGAGVNINNNTNVFDNFVVIGAAVDGCGSGTIYRTAKANPGSAYCLCPGMTLLACRASTSTANGFKDIFQSSLVSGSRIQLTNCEATNNTFDGIFVDNIETVSIYGGKFSNNGSAAYGGSVSGVTFNDYGADTRFNTGGVVQAGSLITYKAVGPGSLLAANNLSDLASVGTARTNLSLGGAAVLNVGTTAGTVAAGDDSRFGAGGSPAASAVTYNPETSAGFAEENGLVEGMPVLQSIVAANVQEMGDYLNRFVFRSGNEWYVVNQRDSMRRVATQVGAIPSTVDGEVIPGIAPLDTNRRVPLANLGSGSPIITTFLRGDGSWAAPTAVPASRTWQAEPVDQGVKAMNADPAAGWATATLVTASICYAFRVYLQAATYTNYIVFCQTVGVSLAANLYAFSLHNADATGSLVVNSGTADAASVWTTTGVRTIGLGAPFVCTSPGYYYILAQMGTAATQPKVSAGNAHGLANIGLAQNSNVAPNAANAPRFGNPITGFTGLTPPPNTGNIADGANSLVFWIGLN